jgi:hypothetical protein
MSSCRRLIAFVIMGAFGAAHAAAQDVHDLARQLDASVIARDRVARELAEYRRREAKTHVYADSTRMLGGRVMVVSMRELTPIVRKAVMGADAFLSSRLGAAAAGIDSLVLSVRTDTSKRDEHFASVAQRAPIGEVLNAWVPADSTDIARAIIGTTQFLLVGNATGPAGSWGGSLPTDTITNDQWTTVRVALVTSTSTLGPKCYAGDIKACEAALGLSREADPLHAWYDAAGRRLLVAGMAQSRRMNLVVRGRCIAGDDSECLRLLQLDGVVGSEAPIGGLARVTLVEQALKLGGPGAAGRFVTSRGSVGDALTAAAQAPLDSSVHVWQRRVRGSDRHSDNMTVTLALIAVGWVAVLYGLALRSGRWR